ncbi:transglycosylase family protein [Streptomyces rubradiris]|uniref:Peptidoglycan-binding protein LysM n=1 Tax=Streptomyces rubradiris TaxID=285531 RepID=A0ABQ3RN26_STRRR|nr:transglycosylase family protein [Streptomyces rubradiris]GHH02189.1 peptidoglycan-binding protein LysM [Streptomyces rubradiris]GHI57271.1 peptidoglycan-binding protein LysM [Streptomyces rubradiris]
MLSGNGRHRRPRQAPALLVAAGVTGSAIAIPLLGAASANAADGTTWDKVAECESGGSWSADNGTGYYGGLLISQEDWDKYGGGQYAASPDQASRQQQIAVAEKILADRGTTPWATCALLSGLTRNSGSMEVDTGVDDSGGTGGSADASGSAGGSGTSKAPGTSDPSGRPDASPSTGSTGSTADPGSGPSSDPTGTPSTKQDKGDKAGKGGEGTGKAAGEEADKAADKGAGETPGSTGTDTTKSDKSPTPDTGNTQYPGGAPTATPDAGTVSNPQQAAGSWSLVDTGTVGTGGRHRGPSADETLTNGQNGTASGRHASRETDTYTVRQGDSLSSIADSLDVDGGWHALYAGNKKAIGADPNHITAGQTLNVQGESDAK